MIPRSRTIVFLLALPTLAVLSAREAPAARAGTGSSPSARKAQVRAANRSLIEWKEWGPAAFLRAKALDRPILLNIVVSWSRQCREMDRSWSDPRIAALVNDGFVPVRVDADRRPDIRDRYPTGEWPSVTLLLPTGDPIFFSPKDGKADPVRVRFGLLPPDRMRPVLEETLLYYRKRRGSLKKAIEDGLKAEIEPQVQAGRIDDLALTKVVDALRANFDSLHGGWTKAPKFPITGPVEALLFSFQHNAAPGSREVAERALHGIIDGPLFDRVEGGVHRLALGEDWSRPEYEKLLDRNVAVLDDLLAGYLVTLNPDYAERAGEIVAYLEGPLRRPGGGHYSSQSSDPSSPDGGEYYRAAAADRGKKPAPPVDRLVPVGWSAKAAAAEMRAAILLSRPELMRPARETLTWLLANAYGRSRGVSHAIEGDQANQLVYLEDQVTFIEGMIDASQCTADRTYLEAAADVAHFAILNLRDHKKGLFGDTIPQPGAPAPFLKALHPFEPNCRMARVLARLYYLDTSEKTFRDAAGGVLTALAGRYEKMGPAGAYYALAVSEYRYGPTWVWIVGRPAMQGFEALLAEANRIPEPWKLIVRLDPLTDRDAIVRQGFVRPPPVLYLSSGTHTSKPAQSPNEVLESYKSLSALLAEEKKKARSRESPPGGSSGSETEDPKTGPAIRPGAGGARS